jgi:hypothetical protein
MEASFHFLEKIMVNNRTLDELQIFLLAPAVFLGIVCVLLWYFSPGLRLEAGQPGKTSRATKLMRRMFGLLAIGLLVTTMLQQTSPGLARQGGSSNPTSTTQLQITIDIDKVYADIKAGDTVEYTSVVTNNGTENTPPLILAMNIINLDASGDVVDPEDWSPQRTQYSEEIAPGESITTSWRVNAILSGDFMVYMVVIPEPDSAEATSWPITSTGIHLTVASNPQVNPGGVLPLIIIIPVVVVIGIGFVFWWRRRSVDTGKS